MNRDYSTLQKMKTFEERFEYLRLKGRVGEITFGYDRYLNQILYRSSQWKKIRDIIIMRDMGCDLGIAGLGIWDRIIIHHMNPISVDDIEKESQHILDPEFLICTSMNTHNAIHYSNEYLKTSPPQERKQNDTCPWLV